MAYNHNKANPRALIGGQEIKNFTTNDNGFLKPLPPFGKLLELSLSIGKKPTNSIFFFAGIGSWQKAKTFTRIQTVLCLPYGEDPFKYRWPIMECDVLVIDTGGLEPDYIEKLAYCLLIAGASIVRCLAFDKVIVYRREAQPC